MNHTFLIARTLVAGALTLFAVGCVSPEAHRRVVGANAALQAERAQMLEDQQQLALENDRLRSQVEDLGSRAADASWIEEQKKRIADLLDKYGTGSPRAVSDVEMVKTSEGYAFRLAGGVLFSSGSNVLTSAGKQRLDGLIADLRGRRIRVEGHTDDIPITRSQWGTNLRLSIERALSVADYLIQTGGLEGSRISAAGYGEYRPAVEGTDDAARQKNRRVEILLLDG
ncbi:MAG: OmpA family protein [Planctomycetes bacterium]|nr:OmpA family protein [Planctomycetota bacterium]